MVSPAVRKGLRWLVGLALGALLCGCGAEKGAEVRAELVLVDTIRLEEPDTLFLGEFLWLEVEWQPFRLYVPDFRLGRVVVFDSSGRPVQVIGHRGVGPGALYPPYRVLLHEKFIYVFQQYGIISRFDRSGHFMDRLRFPEGYDPATLGFKLLDAGHLVVPSFSYAEPCSSVLEPVCAETRVFSVVDTGLRRVTGRFGVYPRMYWQGNYAARAAEIDVQVERRLAVAVYGLSSEMQFYAVSDTGGVLLRRVVLRHPAWRDPPQELPARLAVENRARYNELMRRTSWMSRAYFVADTLVLAYFYNKKPGFYERPGWDDAAIEPYGVLVSTSGRWQQPLELPGPVLGRDAAYHVYIRLSDEPGRRLIGRYRVEVRQ